MTMNDHIVSTHRIELGLYDCIVHLPLFPPAFPGSTTSTCRFVAAAATFEDGVGKPQRPDELAPNEGRLGLVDCCGRHAFVACALAIVFGVEGVVWFF